MENIKERVGRNIRKIRSDRDYTQEQLADRAGLHFTYIGSVERGERNISIENLERIAQALGVEIHKLLVR